MTTTVWWIRRDLRLRDNPALLAACAGGCVLPVFVLDRGILDGRLHRHATRRRAFLFDGLRVLDTDLQALGSRLFVLAGRPLEVLREVLAVSGARAIHAAEDFSPYARQRDAAIARELPLQLHPGLTVHHPGQVLSKQNAPYTIFTPFYRAWRALGSPGIPCPAPKWLPLPAICLRAEPLPVALGNPDFPAGEAEALRRMDSFLAGPVSAYALQRDVPAVAGTSTLSPYLRFGMVSPRTAAHQVTALGEGSGAETWLKELVWREFYLSVIYHFPRVMQGAFNPRLRAVRWRDAPADLAAWQQGRTGYPIVDAFMRQLLATGWMHNRGRMIVASFLSKDLLLDWRHGEQWFMDHLLDGDPAANNGGWQWAAGVGTDAAPYFRIFNPVLQGGKFDPHGTFIRQYVPELVEVPLRYLQQPWTMPPLEQALCGVELGQAYPRPIVEHAMVKPRTLEAYKASQAAYGD